MDQLICPITLEPFTHPVVIDCGHTFDKAYIQRLLTKKCPLCNAIFTDTTRVNWIVAQALNLNINTKKSRRKRKHYKRKTTPNGIVFEMFIIFVVWIMRICGWY